MDSAAELNLELNESNKEEKQEQIGRDGNPSAEDISKQIQANFGDSVGKAFQGKKIHLILARNGHSTFLIVRLVSLLNVFRFNSVDIPLLNDLASLLTF